MHKKATRAKVALHVTLLMTGWLCCGVQPAAQPQDGPRQPMFYERVMARLFPPPIPSETASYTLQYLFGSSEMQISFTDAPSGVEYQVRVWRVRKGQPSITERLDRSPANGRSVEEVAAAMTPSTQRFERLVHRASPEGTLLARGLTLTIPAQGSEQIVLHGRRYTFLIRSAGRSLSVTEWVNTEVPKDNSPLMNWMIAVRTAFEDLAEQGPAK